MRQHAVYPTVFPTVRSKRSALMRLLRWVLLLAAIVLMLFGTATLIAILNGREAQLDSAFMQGMTAGHQLCRGGV